MDAVIFAVSNEKAFKFMGVNYTDNLWKGNGNRFGCQTVGM